MRQGAERAGTRGLGDNLETRQSKAEVSMLFAEGARPSATDIELLLAAAVQLDQIGRIAHRPPDDHGWLEFRAQGLAFDLRGLAPGMAASILPAEHVYGLPSEMEKFGFEAISLSSGAHIAAGGALMTVVRNLMGLAVNLALELPLMAVCWNPARTWMDPRYFSRVVMGWLSGGSFPALGLTGLRRMADGTLESSGLAFFVGQEVRVPGREGEPPSETMKLAGRVIDHLVRHGAPARAEQITGLVGEVLVLEPSGDGRLALVRRLA
jgi:hypothetical protein